MAKTIKKIKSGLFSRSLSLTKIALSTGSQLTKDSLVSLFKKTDADETNWVKKVLGPQAELISQELGQLKGSLMKAGQMLSLYGEYFLPPETNQFLKTLQNQSPPLEWPEIEKVLMQNLGPDVLLELDIETNAYASASIGQVHLARVRSTGERLALKIQYPGIREAIDNDLGVLKSLLSILKLLPKELNTAPLFKEVKEMLLQETDYLKEAEYTQLYFEKFKDHPYIKIPKVYNQFTSSQVLATEFIEGENLGSEAVKSLSQERRNRLSQHYLEHFFSELFVFGVVQTDPHLGNYLVEVDKSGKDQDKLVVLDFGACRVFSKDFITNYKLFIKAALNGDTAGLFAAALPLGFLYPDDPEELKSLFTDFCFSIVEPYLEPLDFRNHQKRVSAEGVYNWGESDLPDRLSKILIKSIRDYPLRTPPREIIFLDRKTGGTFFILKILGAKINGRNTLMPFIQD